MYIQLNIWGKFSISEGAIPLRLMLFFRENCSSKSSWPGNSYRERGGPLVQQRPRLLRLGVGERHALPELEHRRCPQVVCFPLKSLTSKTQDFFWCRLTKTRWSLELYDEVLVQIGGITWRGLVRLTVWHYEALTSQRNYMTGSWPAIEATWHMVLTARKPT